MFKIYFQHLVHSFIRTLLLVFVSIMTFFILFDFFRLIGSIVYRNIPLWPMIVIFFKNQITTVCMTAPIILFLAIVFTLQRKENDCELIALQCLGVKKLKIYTPFLFISFFIAIIVFILECNILPASARNYRIDFRLISKKFIVSGLTPNKFFNEISGVVMLAENIDREKNKLYNIFINKDPETIIYAKEGEFIYENGYSSKLRLKDGNGIIIGKNGRKFDFKSYEINISSSSLVNPSNQNLFAREMPIKDLINTQQNDVDSKELQERKTELYNRLDLPIRIILFSFCAFIIGIGKETRGGTKVGKPIFIFLASYYLLSFMILGLIRRYFEFISPVFIFIPSILCILWCILRKRNLYII